MEDEYGTPIRDGAYFITLIAANTEYVHPYGEALSNGTKLELWNYEAQKPELFKFFVEPDNAGNIHIRIAGNPAKYMHLQSSDSSIAIADYDSASASNFKWKLQKVPSAPLESGRYMFALSGTSSPVQYLHVNSPFADDTAFGSMNISEYTALNKQPYEWDIVKQTDNTYTINVSDTDSYVSYQGDTPENVARLETSYKNNGISNWIIEEGSVDGAYRILPATRDSIYAHAVGHSSTASTPVELLLFDADHVSSYEWVAEKVAVEEATPFENGKYRIKLAGNTDIYMHSDGTDPDFDGIRLITYGTEPTTHYEWDFENKFDNYYEIRHSPTQRRLETKGGITANGTEVGIANYGAAPKRWGIEKGSADGLYRIRFYQNPDEYLHSRDNSTEEWATPELLMLNTDNLSTFEWIFEKVE